LRASRSNLWVILESPPREGTACSTFAIFGHSLFLVILLYECPCFSGALLQTS
jgi:hypothetical protein